jgi:hypothetical protein
MSTVEEPISAGLQGLAAAAADDDQIGGQTVNTVSLWPPAQEDRQSPRCRVPGVRRPCQLIVGDDAFAARLLNESSTGLAVLAACSKPPKPGQNAEICIEAGQRPVRVVYAMQIGRPKDAEPGEFADGPCFQIGCVFRKQRSLWNLLGRRL